MNQLKGNHRGGIIEEGHWSLKRGEEVVTIEGRIIEGRGAYYTGNINDLIVI